MTHPVLPYFFLILLWSNPLLIFEYSDKVGLIYNTEHAAYLADIKVFFQHAFCKRDSVTV